jgi:hypothetical protein
MSSDELRRRLATHVSDSYLLVVSVMKGVVFAEAAFVIAIAFDTQVRGEVALLAANLLVVSLAGSLLTYIATNFGAKLLPDGPMRLLDSLLPLLVALAEFTQFAILAKALKDNEPSQLRYWYWAVSGWGLIACLTIVNARSHIRTGAFDPADWRDVMRSHRKSLIQDIIGASVIVVVSPVGAWLWSDDSPYPFLVAALLLLSISIAIYHQHHEQRRVHQALAPRAPTAA